MHLKKLQRLTAVMLSLIMITSQAAPAFAAGDDGPDYYSDEYIQAIRVSDEYAEKHKSGVFNMVAGTMNITEGERSIEIPVVRYGGTEGEATVDFKIIDVSTKYGEDYVVKVGDGLFKETLEENPDAEPLINALAEVEDITEEEEIDEDDVIAIIDTASTDSALTVNSVLESEGVDLSALESEEEEEEEPAEEIEEDITEEAETEAATEEISEEASEDEEISEEASEEVSEEEADEADAETEDENASKSAGKSSGLRGARNAFIGNTSDRPDWTETVDNSNQEAIDFATGEIQDWAEEIPGVTTTLTFEDGEYIKFITIEIIDDNLSESDEQVMFFLSNPSAGELGDVYKAYLNIADNDASEGQKFEMSAKAVTVSRDEGVVEITVKRTSGIAKFASVDLTTGEVTAKAGEDYEAIVKEVVFPQGVTERTVEIPILKERASQDGLQFMVYLDTSKGTVNAAKSSTIVTLDNPTGTDSVTSADLSSDSASEEDEQAETADDNDPYAGLLHDEGGYYYEVDLDSSTTKTAFDHSTSTDSSIKTNGRVLNINNKSSSSTSYTFSNIDLSHATSIDVSWKNDTQGTYYENKSWCGKVKSRGYHTDGYNYLQFDGSSDKFYDSSSKSSGKVVFDHTSSNTLDNFTVPSGAKKSKGSITFYTTTASSNKNSNLHIYTIKVYVEYPTIKFTVGKGTASATTNNTASNSYIDIKTWMPVQEGTGYTYDSDNNAYYTYTNTSVQAGTLTLSNTGQMALGSTVKFTANIYDEYKDKVYFEGVYLSGSLGNFTVTSSNNSSCSLTFDKTFIDGRKSKLKDSSQAYYTNYDYTVIPIYKPRNAYIYFPQSSEGQIVNHGTYGENDIMKVPMVDTVYLSSTAVEGSYVTDYIIKNSDKKVTSLKIFGRTYTSSSTYLKLDESIDTFRKSYISGYQNSMAITTSISSRNGTYLVLKPNTTYTQVEPVYGTPYLYLAADPYNLTTAKNGVVYYIADAGEAADETTGSSGTEATIYTTMDENKNLIPIEIDPLTLGEVYSFNAVTDDGYYVRWKDFTGDEDHNGKLDLKEKAKSGITSENRSVVGSTYNYTAKDSAFPVLYYGFYPTVESTGNDLSVEGQVSLLKTPIFPLETSKKTTKSEYIKNATVTVGDNVVTTDSEGYFYVEDPNFETSSDVLVNIYFDDYSYDTIMTVNSSSFINISEYDTFSVPYADVLQYDPDDDVYESIDYYNVPNSGNNVKIKLTAKSSSTVLYAAQAEFTAYDKNGNFIYSDKVDTTETSGEFEYIFNPDTKGISPGSTLTVKFYDQTGKEYLEHEMGITFTRYIGSYSVLSQLDGCTDLSLDLLGSISSVFGTGYTGSESDFNTFEETGDGGYTHYYKVLKLGFTGTGSADASTKNSIFEDKLEDLTKAIKDKANATASGNKTAAKEADDKIKEASDKTDSNNEKTKKETEISAEASVNFSVAVEIIMEQVDGGEYAFNSLLFTIGGGLGAGMTVSIPTPLIINIVIGFEVSASVSGLIIISAAENADRQYFSDEGSIDFGNIAEYSNENGKEGFETYNSTKITVTVSLSAGVGLSVFMSVAVKGEAEFDINFDSLGSSSGDVTFSASIEISVLIFSGSWKLAEDTYNLFSKGGEIIEPELAYNDITEMSLADLSYMDNRTSWSGLRSVKALDFALDDNDTETYEYGESELISGNNPYPKSVIKKLEDGRFIMVFIDDSTNGKDEYNYATVKYSLYNGSTWSTPVVIDNDDTIDDAPDIYVLENGKVLAVWSSADEPLTADDTAITALNKLDIKSAVFDPSTDTFSEPIYITKTTDADLTADSAPKLVSGSFLNNDDYIMCYYTKSEYSISYGDNGVLGDMLNPYSVIAYLFYDVDAGEWVHTYSDVDKAEIIETGMAYTNDGELVTEENFDVYEAEWYGQSFVDLGVYLTINDIDITDEYGYWTETPDITVSDEIVDPLVIDSDAISYNNLSIFAYTVDLDGSNDTIYDREVYAQVYDFDDNSFTYPIQITSNDVNDSQVKLVRFTDSSFNDATYLVWLSDGDIKALNFSNTYKNCLAEYESGGETYYYINKADPVYRPEMLIADAGDDTEIAEFAITTETEDVYVLWTQSDVTYVDGVENGDEECTDPENQFLEYQVYGTRYTVDPDDENDMGGWSAPMQLTYGQGMIYSDLTPYAAETGTVSLVAERGESQVDSEYGVVEDVSARSMVRLDFSDFDRIELSDIEVEEFMGDGTSYVGVTVTNTGMTEYDDLSVKFYSDGELFETAELSELPSGLSTSASSLIGGTAIDAELYSGTTLLAKTSTEVVYAPEITFDEFNMSVVSRDYAAFTAVLTNDGTADAENVTVSIVSKATGETLDQTVIESLGITESAVLDFSAEITDDMFTEITPDDETYYYQEDAEFMLYTDLDEDIYKSTTTTRYITDNEYSFISSVDPVLCGGEDSVDVAVGGYGLAYDSVSEEYRSIQTIWESSDESVAYVTTDGLIKGISLGTAELTAKIMPCNRTYFVLDDGTMASESIYDIIPSQGIITKTITVNVLNEVVTEETTEETTEEITEETSEETTEEITEASTEETTAVTDETSETTTKKTSSGGSGSSSSSRSATTTTEADTEETTEAAVSSDSSEDEDSSSSDSTEADTAEDSVNVFDDVKGTWAEEAVSALAELGIVSGTGDNLFEPERNITRAEFVTMLMRMLGDYVDADTTDTEQFADISEDSYYSEYILKAKAAGIAAGYENNEFRPDSNVTRQEMFAFTYRALLSLGLIEAADAELEYTDKDSVSSYAVEAIASLTAEGIVSGDNGEVKPLDNARRNEAAQMMYSISKTLIQTESEE